MSPANSNPRKRRRLTFAALTANGAGAAAGAAAQALIHDPVTSALVGGFVGGTVGDLLLQVTRARNDALPDEVPPAEPEDAQEPDGRARRRELGDGHGRVGGARPGYARCTARFRPGAVPAAPSSPHRAGTATPRHLRHRQLHRGAQRFARRIHERDAGLQQPGGTRGTS